MCSSDLFDIVGAYLPDEMGEPAGWLAFSRDGRQLWTAEPVFFRRFIAATPHGALIAFPEQHAGARSFHLVDESGAHMVATATPLPPGGAALPLRNSLCLMSIEDVRRSAATEPRVTVLTSLANRSCCAGPWKFVVGWIGRRATIDLELPSAFAKPSAHIGFVEQHLVQRCQSCGKIYVIAPGLSHRCVMRY